MGQMMMQPPVFSARASLPDQPTTRPGIRDDIIIVPLWAPTCLQEHS